MPSANFLLSSARKTDPRSALLLLLPLWSLGAQAQMTLSREQVVELAARNDPSIKVAEARARESEVARVGAGALAQSNPTLSASVGPRFIPNVGTAVDANVSLTWPLEFFGVSSTKKTLADERALAASAAMTEATRLAVSEALQLWTTARHSEARLKLEQSRAQLDDEILRITRAKRTAGSVGDGDVALAQVLSADGHARAEAAAGTYTASLHLLRSRLGLPVNEPIALPPIEGEQLEDEQEALPELSLALQRLEQHPTLIRAAAIVSAEGTNADLQQKLGLPVPRLLIVGERSPEYTARGGIDLPLPIYQRNQTDAAIASARAQTSKIELSSARTTQEAELRAAHARMASALAVLHLLEAALPAVSDSEHLATRSYELGQGSLADVVAARRESNSARVALLDARAGLRRARILFNLATGAPP